ncbi:MAG: 4-hydroxythreonine-4-phosphate dehydrogenase PdxA [Rubrimonas sp.]
MRPLALTMGEPAGVGGEIAVAAWASGLCRRPFFIVDDPDRIESLGAPVAVIDSPAHTEEAFSRAIPVLTERLPGPVTPGRPSPEAAPHVVRSIERGVALVQDGAAAAIVTNPIDKGALHAGAGFSHPGHTEFLAALAGADHVVMLLASPLLRVVPLTIHQALATVAGSITSDMIVQTVTTLHDALRQDFAIEAPRIAVAGVNPHAGEGGLFGREDIEVIAPAIERLRASGLDVRGPLPADTMFHARARTGYDAAVCMYHDQALIPLKTLDFDRGVNVTLGLPFIRTSPDHGVAYDIAGKRIANPTSLIEAINLAAAMADARGL